MLWQRGFVTCSLKQCPMMKKNHSWLYRQDYLNSHIYSKYHKAYWLEDKSHTKKKLEEIFRCMNLVIYRHNYRQFLVIHSTGIKYVWELKEVTSNTCSEYNNLYYIIQTFNVHFLGGTVNSVGRFCAHLITGHPADSAESYDLHNIRVVVNKRL